MSAAPQEDSDALPSPAARPVRGVRPTSVAARLRAEYAREVAALGYHAHSVPGALAHLALHLGLAVAMAAAFELLLPHAPRAAWLVYPLLAFLIATRFRAVGNMLHEACHGMLVRGKRHNRNLGHLLAVLDLTALDPYRRDHFSHHLHLGDAEKDLDFQPRRRFGFADPDRPFVKSHLLRPLLLIHLPAFIRPVLFHREDPVWVTLLRWSFIGGLLAVAHFVVGWDVFLRAYVIPYFVAYQVIRYWSDAVDHAGIISSADEFHRSRNHVFAWGWLNRLVFPRNDEYHLTHHLFPAVPTPFQGRVHQLLLRDADYAAREHAFSSLTR
ncbi:fatty acid desaturase [Myxococcus xanthus]|uniref:Fatty acid desaturase n=1 Tax=Myxococcus xanthus TaxID=34 RepID=A0A7Y4MPV7_MYXXA|nr:fatty acid desaturase [Myxococcus xanthus]NOJ84968.1 fatty acid desaturase [Myxococcus xanthus]